MWHMCKIKRVNLFNLTRMMIINWIIGGDETASGLGGGVMFDIKIMTSIGDIYCAYIKLKIELTNCITDGKHKEIKY
jgi:hypothetical protein